MLNQKDFLCNISCVPRHRILEIWQAICFHITTKLLPIARATGIFHKDSYMNFTILKMCSFQNFLIYCTISIVNKNSFLQTAFLS